MWNFFIYLIKKPSLAKFEGKLLSTTSYKKPPLPKFVPKLLLTHNLTDVQQLKMKQLTIYEASNLQNRTWPPWLHTYHVATPRYGEFQVFPNHFEIHENTKYMSNLKSKNRRVVECEYQENKHEPITSLSNVGKCKAANKKSTKHIKFKNKPEISKTPKL